MFKRSTAVALLFAVAAVAAPVLAGSTTETANLVVDGMVTRNCPVLVRTALRRVEGVESVEASLETKRVTVVYRPETTSPEKITAVIKDQVGLDALEVREARLVVEAMATADAREAVKAAVSELDGVVDVSFDASSRAAVVAYVTAKVSATDIATAIRSSTGFDARPVAKT